MTPAKPEEIAREQIDAQLASSGWVVQDMADLNLAAASGVAVREFSVARGHGQADYLLFVDGQAVGALEAKKVGHTLTGVEGQAVNEKCFRLRDKINELEYEREERTDPR
jgi:type I restriction enzyme R subunit